MSDKPQVVDIKSSTAKSYRITLAGCEVRDAPHSKRSYRPTSLTATKRDGNVSKVELAGPNIKKDGTDSSVWTRETFYAHQEHPAWLTSIIGGLA